MYTAFKTFKQKAEQALIDNKQIILRTIGRVSPDIVSRVMELEASEKQKQGDKHAKSSKTIRREK